MSYITIKLRRGTAAQWTAQNPVLAEGEFGAETDTRKFKIGNGVGAWNSLQYWGGSGGGASAFTDLTDVPQSYTGQGGKLVRVKADASGLEFYTLTIAAGDLPSGIDAAKIADGTISNTEFQYLNGVTSAIQTQLNGKQASLGFTPEDVANKSISVTTDQASNTKYPSVKSVYDWVTGLGYITSAALSGYATQAWVTAQGYITNVITALGYTPENQANKKTTLADNSDTFYPSQKAVKTAVDAKQDALGFTPENVANKSTSVTTDLASNTKYPSVKAVYDWAVATFTTTAAVASQITTALSGYATQAWVTSQGYITNVVTALGYTPANKAGETFTGSISATNLSGTNTGDETQTTIKTKLGAASSTQDGYLTSANWSTFNGKQDALGFTPENSANKKTSLADNSDTFYPSQKAVKTAVDAKQDKATFPVVIQIAASDLTTAITSGTNKAYFRSPFAFTLTGVRASLLTAQSSGSIFTVDINEAGTSVLSTKLTIDNTEKTSTTAATAAVISDSSIADDAEISIDVDQVGTGAAGLVVTLIGTRSV